MEEINLAVHAAPPRAHEEELPDYADALESRGLLSGAAIRANQLHEPPPTYISPSGPRPGANPSPAQQTLINAGAPLPIAIPVAPPVGHPARVVQQHVHIVDMARYDAPDFEVRKLITMARVVMCIAAISIALCAMLLFTGINIFGIIGIVGAGCGIAGALMFWKWLVSVYVLTCALDLILSIYALSARVTQNKYSAFTTVVAVVYILIDAYLIYYLSKFFYYLYNITPATRNALDRHRGLFRSNAAL